jgi:hypothetical protein
MTNSCIYFIELLTIITAVSLIVITSLGYDNATMNNTSLNNITLNNTALINTRMNSSAINESVINSTNETAFRIGIVGEGNKSAFVIDSPKNPVKDASKSWYLIQATPHGTV